MVGTGSLSSLSFIGYLVMSFLTAVNDNLFRWLIIPIAKKQLQTVANSIDSAETRSRQMERKLKGVEALPGPEAVRLLDSGADTP